jgi:O-antigen ligase
MPDKTKLSSRRIAILLGVLMTGMFVLGYMESFRWPLGVPKATHGFLKGMLFLLSAILIAFRKKLSPPIDPWGSIFAVFFVIAYMLSAVYTSALSTAMLYLWYPLTGMVMLYAFSRIRLRNRFLLLFIQVSVILIFVTATFSFFSLMFRYSVDNIYYLIFQDHRANHLLSELRAVGKYVSLGPYIMLTPICFYFLLQPATSAWRKGLSLFVYGLTSLTAVMSNNRIDVLILALQFLVYLFFLPRKLAVMLLLLSVFIIQFGLSTSKTYFGYNIQDRIINPSVQRDKETVSMRFTYWETAMYNFRNSPIVGIGPNAYNDLSEFPIRRYFGEGPHAGYTMRADEGIGVHNIFIERLSDTGLLGFLAFALLLVHFLRRDIITIYNEGSAEIRTRYILFSLGAWTWILYGITDNGYGAQGMVTFFVIRGVMYHIV